MLNIFKMKSTVDTLNSILFKGLSAILLGLLSGCVSVDPTTITKNDGPQKTLPVRYTPPVGSIFNVGSYKPIFEGIKAKRVGDILTVIIADSTSTTNALNDKNSKTGAADSTSQNKEGDKVQPTWAISNANSAELNNSGTSSSVFTGSISVTVTEVLPNGFLVVAGEKQLGGNQGTQYIRLSGVVNPAMITTDNAVSSNTIADARFEYRSNNFMDASYITSAITRFFYSILPF
jgi:flagellar L-ring protein precursor FlgH